MKSAIGSHAARAGSSSEAVLFVGKKLEPAQETLLVDTLNWQLKRDDRLPKDEAVKWEYPRANLTSQEVVLSGYGRLRDAATGPDGCVYVLTSNRDGRGSPQSNDDRVLKACQG